MNGKELLTSEENQTYFLKDIMEAVKSEELEDDFCLYDKDTGERNLQASNLFADYRQVWMTGMFIPDK